MHGSFWLQSPIFGSVPGDAKLSGTEIDTVEYFGSTYPRRRAGVLRLLPRTRTASWSKSGGLQNRGQRRDCAPDDAWWKKYHVFSVEWTPEAYVFRVDGRGDVPGMTEHISGVPEFLVLSLLSSDWELKDLDECALPATMKVDWVRVWQPTPPDRGRARLPAGRACRDHYRASLVTLGCQVTPAAQRIVVGMTEATTETVSRSTGSRCPRAPWPP